MNAFLHIYTSLVLEACPSINDKRHLNNLRKGLHFISMSYIFNDVLINKKGGYQYATNLFLQRRSAGYAFIAWQ